MKVSCMLRSNANLLFALIFKRFLFWNSYRVTGIWKTVQRWPGRRSPAPSMVALYVSAVQYQTQLTSVVRHGSLSLSYTNNLIKNLLETFYCIGIKIHYCLYSKKNSVNIFSPWREGQNKRWGEGSTSHKRQCAKDQLRTSHVIQCKSLSGRVQYSVSASNQATFSGNLESSMQSTV